eukprot:CAMPEP_0113494858 /NCGR_PEP_ID=MMETSP0014_2-20120614/29318_1 /TAXON_ID=2857 /ORGANISM="Nitzschia sp." /LENGTH=641 /DNA_ID=CAMNT_0000388753 /DNA_START=192 /DNA_END=2117 /DNA_ORIENTATION=- /assembly_acc=CAM_ASM_000159
MTSETYSTFTTGFGGGRGGGGGSTTAATGSGSSTTAVVRRIRTPHPHDVLSGRGGGINAHPGNIVFREWVHARKEDYNLAPNKAEKTRVAMEVMDQVRGQDPPGRFLTRDTTNALGMGMGSGGGGGSWWVEVDENRALAKTSQALREGAPQIRSAHKDEIQQRKVQYAKEHPKPPKQHHSHGNSNKTTNQQRQRRRPSQQQSQSPSPSQSVRGGGGRRRRSSSTTTTTTTTATGSTSARSTSHKRKVSEAFPTSITTDNNAGTAQPIVYGRGGGVGGGGSALTKRLAQGGGGGAGGGFTANNSSSNILWNTINNNNNTNVLPTANIAPAPSAAAASVTTGIGARGLPRRVVPATNYRAIEKLQENARAAAAQQQQQEQHRHRYGGAVVDGGADTPPLVPHPSPSAGAPTDQGRMEQLSIGEPRDDDVVLGFPRRNTTNTDGTSGSLKRVHSLALSEFSFGNITENEMGESPTIDEEFVNPFADESDISSRIAPSAADRTSSNGISAADKASMLRNISSSNGDDYNLGGVPSTPFTATDDNTDQQSHWYVDLVVDENDPTNLESDFTAGVKGIMDAVHPSDWTAPDKADDNFIPTLLMPWRGYNNGGGSGGLSPVGRRSTSTSSSSNNNRGYPVVELDELHQ